MAPNYLKNIAIVGGSGFIGSRLAIDLRLSGHSVTIFDLVTPPSDLSGHCDFVACDIRMRKELEGLFTDYDIVFLLASLLAKQVREDGKAGWATNILGTANVLDEFTKGTSSPRIIFTSSAMVYASPARIYPTPEESLLDGNEIYGFSKLAGEAMVAAASQAAGFQAVIVRLFTVYGPGPMSGTRGHFIGHWLERMQQGLPLMIYGSGEQTVDLTHVADVISAFRAAMTVEISPGGCRIYNIASARETRVCDIAHWIREEEPSIQIHHEPNAYTGASRKFGDISRAAKELSYKPSILPRNGIKSVVRYYLNN